MRSIFALFYAAILATLPLNGKIITIDAGHGGWDPGKIGIHKEREADINLQIANYLQMYLQLGGAHAFLTRVEDQALADTKNADLRARSSLPTEQFAEIFVSIHQNAYSSEKAKGGQVFYYEGSEQGKLLAEAIQNQINTFLQPQSKIPTPNKQYFLLKNSAIPAIIIECGFLTHPDESYMLNSDKYQQKVAWAIYMGILDYFEGASPESALLENAL